MGNRGGAGGSGGNTGADAGYFVSQSKTPSRLSKKNQDIVDAKFEDRGAVKISQGVKTPSIALNVGAKILSKPLQIGSKKTREFFTCTEKHIKWIFSYYNDDIKYKTK